MGRKHRPVGSGTQVHVHGDALRLAEAQERGGHRRGDGGTALVAQPSPVKSARWDVTLCIEFKWSPIFKSLRTAIDIARRSGADNVGAISQSTKFMHDLLMPLVAAATTSTAANRDRG
jgi:hypothetical protein